MLPFKLSYRTFARGELKNYQQMSLFIIKVIFFNPNSLPLLNFHAI